MIHSSKTLWTSLLIIILFIFGLFAHATAVNACGGDYGCDSYSSPCDYGCGGYDTYSSPCDYGCGGYDGGYDSYNSPCDYGCGGNSYAPSYPTYDYNSGCGSCGGYDGGNNGGYNYVQYPYQIYHPVYPAYTHNNDNSYVQYPYQIYHYFQNPNPSPNSFGAASASGNVYAQPLASNQRPSSSYSAGFHRSY